MKPNVTLVQPRPTGRETEETDVGRKAIEFLAYIGHPEIAKDHEKRIDWGEKKYGQRLRTFNGRDALLDAYQEVLDFLSYLMQAIMEGHGECRSIFRMAACLASEVEALLHGNPSLQKMRSTKAD
jgi:hypothetical protein